MGTVDTSCGFGAGWDGLDPVVVESPPATIFRGLSVPDPWRTTVGELPDGLLDPSLVDVLLLGVEVPDTLLVGVVVVLLWSLLA